MLFVFELLRGQIHVWSTCSNEICVSNSRTLGAKEEIWTNKSKKYINKTTSNNFKWFKWPKFQGFFPWKMDPFLWQETTSVNVRSTLHRIQWRTANHGFCLFKGHLEVIGRGLDIPLVCLRILQQKHTKHVFSKKKQAKLSRMLLLGGKKTPHFVGFTIFGVILENVAYFATSQSIFFGWRPPSNFRDLLLHLAHQRPGRQIDSTATGRLGCWGNVEQTTYLFWNCMIWNTLKVCRHDYFNWITLNNYQYIIYTLHDWNKVLCFFVLRQAWYRRIWVRAFWKPSQDRGRCATTVFVSCKIKRLCIRLLHLSSLQMLQIDLTQMIHSQNFVQESQKVSKSPIFYHCVGVFGSKHAGFTK